MRKVHEITVYGMTFDVSLDGDGVKVHSVIMDTKRFRDNFPDEWKAKNEMFGTPTPERFCDDDQRGFMLSALRRIIEEREGG